MDIEFDEMDLEDFESLLNKSIKNSLNQIEENCKLLYKNAIYKQVYLRYNPKLYDRTEVLLDNISSYNKKIDGIEKLIIFSDIPKGSYHSVVTNKDESALVPLFVDGGHDDSSSVMNFYHHYPASNYSDFAKETIENKYRRYGVEVESYKG